MKKVRRILALIGAILLIFMYAATMLLAIFGSENTRGWLMASIVLTVIVPVLLYAIRLIAKVFSGRNQEEAYRKAEEDAAAGSKPVPHESDRQRKGEKQDRMEKSGE